MEDPSQKWEILDCCSSGSEDEEPEKSRLDWILRTGLNLGKKFVITGVVVSSAPIVLPPLIVVSALGVAFSVPFGFVYASYACTEKLMSKLLPSPSPIQMDYVEVYPDEEDEPTFATEKWEKDEEQDMYDGFEMTIDYDNAGLKYDQGRQEKFASGDQFTDGVGVGYDYEELAVTDNLGQKDDESLHKEGVDELEEVEFKEATSKDSKLNDDEKPPTDIVVPVAVGDAKKLSDDEKPSTDISLPVVVGDATAMDDSTVGVRNKEDKRTEGQNTGLLESAQGISGADIKAVDGKGNAKGGKETQRDFEGKNAKVDKVDAGMKGIEERKHQTSSKGKGSDRRGKKKTLKPLPGGRTGPEEDKRHEKKIVKEKELSEEIKTSGENNLNVGQMMNGKSGIAKELAPEVIPEASIRDEMRNSAPEKQQAGQEERSLVGRNDVDGSSIDENKKRVGTEGEQGEYFGQSVEVVALVGSPVLKHHGEILESKGNDSVSEDSDLHGDEGSVADEKIWKQIDAIRVIVGFKVPRHASYFEELKALYLFTGIQPPSVFMDPSNLAEFYDKLRFLMSVIGVK